MRSYSSIIGITDVRPGILVEVLSRKPAGPISSAGDFDWGSRKLKRQHAASVKTMESKWAALRYFKSLNADERYWR